MVARYLGYFLDFSVLRDKLRAFRVCFFTLVGLDGILQLPHAPRYGAGDFNVGHIAWLQDLLPEPGRALMVVIFLLQAYLGLRIAMGAAVRTSVWLLTGLYGYAYFVSQLDSYQHHYLVFLILLLCCFVPWRAATGDAPSAQKTTGTAGRPDHARVTSWALRLILVQVGIVYLWAAITKCESLWLDGTLLTRQLQPGTARDMAEWLGMGSAATAVMLAEFFLAFALISGRLWRFALVVGVSLHAGIEFGAELRIGIFSYYMFGLYLLLVPDRWAAPIGAQLARMLAPLRSGFARLAQSRTVLLTGTAAGLSAGLLLGMSLPLAEGLWFAGICTGFTLIVWGCELIAFRSTRGSTHAAGTRRQRALALIVAHAIACAAIPLLPETHERIADYYKYWAGSARRLGDWEQAGAGYAQLVKLRPDWAPAHYYLGRIAHRDKRTDDALSHYQRAQRANDRDYRSFLQAALLHHNAGRGPQALAAAQHAASLLQTMRRSTSTQRAQQQARQLIDQWSGR